MLKHLSLYMVNVYKREKYKFFGQIERKIKI